MTSYDTWLAQQVNIHMSGCTPKVIGIHQEPSEGDYMTIPIYSCEECDNEECEYWEEFHK